MLTTRVTHISALQVTNKWSDLLKTINEAF